MTRAIPSDTWIYQLELEKPKERETSIKLSGYAPSATMLVDALEKHPEFDHVELIRASSAPSGGKEQVEVRTSWTIADPALRAMP